MKLSEQLPTILEAIEREAFTAGWKAGFREGQQPEAVRRDRPDDAFGYWQWYRALQAQSPAAGRSSGAGEQSVPPSAGEHDPPTAAISGRDRQEPA